MLVNIWVPKLFCVSKSLDHRQATTYVTGEWKRRASQSPGCQPWWEESRWFFFYVLFLKLSLLSKQHPLQQNKAHSYCHKPTELGCWKGDATKDPAQKTRHWFQSLKLTQNFTKQVFLCSFYHFKKSVRNSSQANEMFTLQTRKAIQKRAQQILLVDKVGLPDKQDHTTELN